ncbi:unnamed protein product [Calypogeia fissa]
MGLLNRRSISETLLQVGLLLLANSVLQSLLALAQKPVIFQYGGDDQSGLWLQVPGDTNAAINEVTNADILCLGDFNQTDQGLMLTTVGSATGNVSGRCLYKVPITLIQPCSSPPVVTSFSSTFQLMTSSRAGSTGTLQGVAFIIASDTSTEGEGGGYLGWLDSSTNNEQISGHNFAVEVDLFQNVEFHDPAAPHVGVDKNSLTSEITTLVYNLVGIAPFDDTTYDQGIELTEEITICLWVQYDGLTEILEVFISGTTYWGDPLGSSFLFDKQLTPILSTVVNLTDIITKQGMFIGFSGSISNNQTGDSAGGDLGFTILEWMFNSDGLAPDLPRNADGTYISPSAATRRRERKRIIHVLVITIPTVSAFLVLVFIILILYKRNAKLSALTKKYEIEEEALNRGCQNFKYRVLSSATKGFSADRLLGSGGFGSVYKGQVVLKGEKKQSDVAVKRISATSHQGAQEFVAEVKIIGQAQHRYLVRLLGWCHEKGELLLVYDYMPNGSVDQHLFNEKDSVLTWSRRLKIVSGVATALAYLHEEWEQRVIHRDVKSSNVMLDKDFNARLGDFGLARLSQHDQAPPSTAVLAGTYGYMAPELAHTLKPTEKTDVYSFGALVLEMATGKKPLLPKEDRESFDEILLVNWVWSLYRDDALLDAADSRLKNAYEPGEMVMLLKIGLLCSHPNPDERPSMREVLNIWKGSTFPPLPRSKPVPIFPLSTDDHESGIDTDQPTGDTTLLFMDDHSDRTDSFNSRFYSTESADHSRVTISSDLYPHSATSSEQPKRGNHGGYANTHVLRHRPHTVVRAITSLPF